MRLATDPYFKASVAKRRHSRKSSLRLVDLVPSSTSALVALAYRQTGGAFTTVFWAEDKNITVSYVEMLLFL